MASLAARSSVASHASSSSSGSRVLNELRVSRRYQERHSRTSRPSVPRLNTAGLRGAAELKFADVLPPLFICVIIGTIWSIYSGLHLLPLLQVDVPRELRVEQEARRGQWQLVVSQTLVLLLLTCYVRAVVSSPGSVPDTATWKIGHHEASGQVKTPLVREVKVTGERRHCKWCLKYKPDRCHHCRVCNNCVLRMDHHCPWIMNCVGFGNHKYFFLLVVYTVAACGFIFWTLLGTVRRSVKQEMPITNRFLLVLGLVLSLIMGTLMTIFLCFHSYLMLHGMTTIEFCEKSSAAPSRAGRDPGKAPAKPTSYDQGLAGNLAAVLGPRPWLWLLPICPPAGDGTFFPMPGDAPDAEADPEWTGYSACAARS